MQSKLESSVYNVLVNLSGHDQGEIVISGTKFYFGDGKVQKIDYDGETFLRAPSDRGNYKFPDVLFFTLDPKLNIYNDSLLITAVAPSFAIFGVLMERVYYTPGKEKLLDSDGNVIRINDTNVEWSLKTEKC